MIEEEKFYEAHEVLETLWFPKRKIKDRKTLILKGFINASVALELNKRGKREGALKVWKNYIKYKIFIKEEIFKKVEKVLDECYEKYLSTPK